MDEQGWVSISRKIMDDPLWRKKPYSEGQALVELIMLANHKDTKAYYQGYIVEFKRGTITTSMLSLADKWGWDRKKLRRFFKVLEMKETATIKTSTHGTTITLINYDLYQNNIPTKRTTKRTTTSPTDSQPLPINNNDNNENNENKKEIVRHKHGEYNNVLLSDEELNKLKAGYPTKWADKLEALSNYMKSTGKHYKDHYATIRNWIRADIKKGGETHGDNNTGEKGKSFDLENYL